MKSMVKSMDLSNVEYLIVVLAAFYLGRSYTMLALSFRSTLNAEDKTIISYTPRPFGLSLYVLGNASPRFGSWTLR